MVSVGLATPDLGLGERRHNPGGHETLAGVSGHAWRHEMELAQAQAWLGEGVLSLGSGAPPSASEMRDASSRSPHAEDQETPAPSHAGSRQLSGGHRARVVTDLGQDELAPWASRGDLIEEAMSQTAAAQRLSGGGFSPANVAQQVGAPSSPAFQQLPQPPLGLPLGAIERDVLVLSGPKGLADGVHESADDEAPAQRLRADLARRAGEELPVRIHIEGNEQAAAVWIGLSPQAAADVHGLQKVIAQWLSGRGYGPARWVCNGRPLAAPEEGEALPELSVQASAEDVGSESGALNTLHGDLGGKP